MSEHCEYCSPEFSECWNDITKCRECLSLCAEIKREHNRLMSDTPRTDALMINRGAMPILTTVPISFARQLERENNKLRNVLSILLEHIVTERDGIDGGTILSVTDCPVPISIAQLALDALD